MKNPQTYNEKVQWAKLHDRNPLYTTLVDKYKVKSYVSSIIGEEHVIPTIGAWESFDDIDFNELPNQFVLKCNHDSGSVVICKDKALLDIQKTKLLMEKALKQNYFWDYREWPYKDVKPLIIAEKYMEDSSTKDLRDYKFLTFNGEPRVMFVATDRQNKAVSTKFDYYDMDYKHLDFEWVYPNADVEPEKPKCFSEMVELSRKLAKDIPHVRVDLYEINGKVYFGEYTFFHESGLAKFHPKSWDYILGSWYKLKI